MRTEPVIPPTRKEMLTLRLMILLGVLSMIFFLGYLMAPNVVTHNFLYVMLIVSIVFICLKVLIEWVHYFYITVPETPVSNKTYTVDILTTFCAGEPYDMIVECLTAIQAITYPHQAYLCDEADDPYLKQVCKKLGVHHVTRTNKKDAKAGNINNALKQASGEICVVLDPDHIPFPEFLDLVIPYFNDPDIGYVQIVQAYRNHNQGLIAKGAAQQTFQFYGPMMMSMNKYGTVLAIGANCTFRREALNSIGGHAAGLAEDMHTAMQLHAAGWKSVYVPAVLARGLVPSTISAYYKQQLKWSRGVFELWFTSYPKLFKKFTWQQKIHYGLIPMHYLSGFVFLINFLIPVLALVFNKGPININLLQFSILGSALAIMVILIRHFVQKWVMEDEERGFHIVGGLLMIGTWWVYVLGFFYTIIRREVPYIPTPKSHQVEKNLHLNIINGLVIIISAGAVIYGLHKNYTIYTLIMAGFAVLNCLIMLFTIVASRQEHFRVIKKERDTIYNIASVISNFKAGFWLFRRRIYAGVRNMALIITIFTIGFLIYLAVFRNGDLVDNPQLFLVKSQPFSWQRAQTGGFLTLDGTTDNYGNRFDYYQLGAPDKHLLSSPKFPVVKILTPAKATNVGDYLVYHSVILKGDEWTLAGADNDLQYKWELAELDATGGIKNMQYLGNAPSVTLSIPQNPAKYKLCLYIIRGMQFKAIYSNLNTPL